MNRKKVLNIVCRKYFFLSSNRNLKKWNFIFYQIWILVCYNQDWTRSSMGTSFHDFLLNGEQQNNSYVHWPKLSIFLTGPHKSRSLLIIESFRSYTIASLYHSLFDICQKQDVLGKYQIWIKAVGCGEKTLNSMFFK